MVRPCESGGWVVSVFCSWAVAAPRTTPFRSPLGAGRQSSVRVVAVANGLGRQGVLALAAKPIQRTRRLVVLTQPRPPSLLNAICFRPCRDAPTDRPVFRQLDQHPTPANRSNTIMFAQAQATVFKGNTATCQPTAPRVSFVLCPLMRPAANKCVRLRILAFAQVACSAPQLMCRE